MSLRARLAQRRAQQFVGRSDEQALFDTLLTDDGPVVLLLDGPSGVGKSTLLRLLADRAEAREVPTFLLDLGEGLPTPAAFLDRLHDLTPLRFDGRSLAFADTPGQPFVLLLDTFEDAPALAPWLRERFVPGLPDEGRLVVAGQMTDGAAWRTDAAFGDLVATATLGPLPDDDARALLARRGVPDDACDAIVAFSHGHPLALALAAETLPDASSTFDPDGSDLISALLDRFLRLVPDATAQHALYAAALVLYLDEEMLGEMLELPPDEARARFDWLRTVAFVGTAPRGIVLHDLVRKLLAHDVRWRMPDLYHALHRRARLHYSRRLAHADTVRQATWLSDYLYLYRDNPVVAPLFSQLQAQWSGRMLTAGPAPPGHDAALEAMVQRHEGDEAVRWFREWRARQPDGLRVYYDAQGAVAGLLFALRLDPSTDAAGDPAVAKAMNFLRSSAPLRTGETALYFRFWMDTDAYQGVSAVQSLVFVDTVRAYLGTPGLAFSFLPTSNPALWTLVFALAGLEIIADASFAYDGLPVAVFGHDWRRVPPLDWLDGIARFGLRTDTPADTDRPAVRAVLTHDAFVEGVRDALRNVLRPDVLRQHLLAQTRLVAQRMATHAEPADVALAALLRDAADALDAAPRTRKLHRALVATYFDPAPSQEQASERLDVPFSSYRRHLKAGVEAVAEMLWRDELAG